MAKDTIFVASPLPTKDDGGDLVVLSEQDPLHPGDGWAFVAGPRPVEVGHTPRVDGLLRNGDLVEVSKAGKPKADADTQAGG